MVEKYVVILGAGRGSRMESRDPNHSKVAYPILGKPLINYVIDACKAIKPKEIYTVVGYGGKHTEECVKDHSKVVWQKEILGTGHALMQVKELADKEGDVIVVGGDTPLLTSATLNKVYHKHHKNGNVLTTLTNPRDKALLNFLKLRDEIKNVDHISDEDALLEALESR